MDESFTDLNIDTELREFKDFNLNQTEPKQLEYERALEIISQSILALLDQCLVEFPEINDGRIRGCIDEINKFLSAHEVFQDKELLQYIGSGLPRIIQGYPWKEQIKQK